MTRPAMAKDLHSNDTDEAARLILRQNDRGGYTIPTAGLYPYQWNWDSAFAALGFAEFDINRAWAELETLMAGQWENGMVPHIQFHEPSPGYFPGPDVWGCKGHGPVPSSGISQPPVAASVAWKIFRRDQAKGRDHIRALVPKFVRWHRWFMQWRLENGAICITHPWECGRDNAPDWDAAMAAIDPHDVGEYNRRDTAHVDPHMRPTKYDYDRYIWLVQLGRRLNWDEAALRRENPFRVADPTMTFILLRACRDLLHMAQAIGHDTTEIKEWIEILEKGSETIWNPGLQSYDARDIRTDTFAGSISNASFLCWFAGIESKPMAGHLRRVLENVAYGVPSFDPQNEKFDANRYWRGPVWAIMNALIGAGLAEMGHAALSRQVREYTRTLISKKGFAEYFNPLTGAPAGGGSFTWTAAVWLGWASPTAEDW